MLAKVFQSGNSQAVRLPKAMRFDVDEVEIKKVGKSIILKPKKVEKCVTQIPKKPDWKAMRKALDELRALNFEFERNDLPPQERDLF
ncbi:hypothetical protein SPONN_548 [uncultured Candidatus Thioglobus sp.]|nr:hypothetical protein SPONN_548 [uncultured Candidatus Thioglobus sp.]